LVFFAGAAGSGAMMLLLSAASAGAASTTFGGSGVGAIVSAAGLDVLTAVLASTAEPADVT